MPPRTSVFYRANVIGELNGVATVLTVLIAGGVGISNMNFNGQPPLTRGVDPVTLRLLDAALIVPTVLMMLVQRRVELDGERREGRIGWGIWPLFLWRKVAFDGLAEVRLKVRSGRGWNFCAELVHAETGRTVPLASWGSEVRLEPVVAFARGIGAEIVGNTSRLPKDVRRHLLPELSQSPRRVED